MTRLLSGITATGKLTLGNYLGAIKQFVALQDQYEMYIFVADLHALTNDLSAAALAQNKRDIMALYLACGLDPAKVALFFQSSVSAHSELAWIIENQTSLGELSRMTQFKEKGQAREANKTESIRTGLLTYPALMTADILLYQAKTVPVGADQKQHIELARNIAERFNNKYGPTFTVPEYKAPVIGAKIRSLTEPTKKMSKSDPNPKSAIYLLDEPSRAAQKIIKAVTDSENKIYLAETKPGITNLLTIYAALSDISLEEAATRFAHENYGVLKSAVAARVSDFLVALQTRYRASLALVDEVAKQGAAKAAQVANATLADVSTKLGLR